MHDDRDRERASNRRKDTMSIRDPVANPEEISALHFRRDPNVFTTMERDQTYAMPPLGSWANVGHACAENLFWYPESVDVRGRKPYFLIGENREGNEGAPGFDLELSGVTVAR